MTSIKSKTYVFQAIREQQISSAFRVDDEPPEPRSTNLGTLADRNISTLRPACQAAPAESVDNSDYHSSYLEK
jgi:hypothetical protein